jgi:hypothetical protein
VSRLLNQATADVAEKGKPAGWRVFCHEVRIDSIRPCRWASGLVRPDVYRLDNVARPAASERNGPCGLRLSWAAKFP